MVLRRRRPVSPDGVPVELLDEDHPSWGGRLAPQREAAMVFAVEQGWVRFYGANESPFVDLNRLREAGVPTYSCARLRRERSAL